MYVSRGLGDVYNRPVLGGMRVQIGDEVIDGTVGTRLDDLERDLQA